MKPQLSRDTRTLLFVRGLHVLSAYQPQWLFPDDGRRLKRCPIPSDPWSVTVGDHPSYLHATDIRRGDGPTADEAALAAIRGSGDLRGALGRLAAACDDLIGAYREG